MLKVLVFAATAVALTATSHAQQVFKIGPCNGCTITDSGISGGVLSFTVTPLPTTPPSQPAAPTVSLTASPASIAPGASSTLTWNSSNATSCTGTGFTASGLSGSLAVKPSATTTYGLSCTGAGGTSSASATVTVSSPTAASPDGTQLTTAQSAAGQVITDSSGGKYNFDGKTADSQGDQTVQFNGALTSGSGTILEINHGGHIYVYWAQGKEWFLRTSPPGWQATAAP